MSPRGWDAGRTGGDRRRRLTLDVTPPGSTVPTFPRVRMLQGRPVLAAPAEIDRVLWAGGLSAHRATKLRIAFEALVYHAQRDAHGLSWAHRRTLREWIAKYYGSARGFSEGSVRVLIVELERRGLVQRLTHAPSKWHPIVVRGVACGVLVGRTRIAHLLAEGEWQALQAMGTRIEGRLLDDGSREVVRASKLFRVLDLNRSKKVSTPPRTWGSEEERESSNVPSESSEPNELAATGTDDVLDPCASTTPPREAGLSGEGHSGNGTRGARCARGAGHSPRRTSGRSRKPRSVPVGGSRLPGVLCLIPPDGFAHDRLGRPGIALGMTAFRMEEILTGADVRVHPKARPELMWRLADRAACFSDGSGALRWAGDFASMASVTGKSPGGWALGYLRNHAGKPDPGAVRSAVAERREIRDLQPAPIDTDAVLGACRDDVSIKRIVPRGGMQSLREIFADMEDEGRANCG